MTHMKSQPGLHAHSYSKENSLMNRFVVQYRTPSGWLAIASFDSLLDAYQYADSPGMVERESRITDNHRQDANGRDKVFSTDNRSDLLNYLK